MTTDPRGAPPDAGAAPPDTNGTPPGSRAAPPPPARGGRADEPASAQISTDGAGDRLASRRPADPATADAAVSAVTPTKCAARTRLYRDGGLADQGFPVSEISDYLADPGTVIWLDLLSPDRDDLTVLSAEFGLHPLAIEDAEQRHERPKLDRYSSHLFLSCYAVALQPGTCELTTSELGAFITPRALITVRKDDGLDIRAVMSYWDQNPDLASAGVGYLLYGLLDHVVDGYFTAVQDLDDAIEDLEDQLFSENIREQGRVQRRSFELRKSLVLLRRLVLPMREVVNTVLRRDLHLITEPLRPYIEDVYDHVLRATEWTDSLRDLVTSILETNLTLQGNRMNVITKKVTSWAAIIAVPTFITGFYGMNVPYPGFGHWPGFLTSLAIMAVSATLLYVVFRRKDWL